MMFRRSVLTTILLGVVLIPGTGAASVRMNEICWMGSADNANAEWIELYNDGSEAVSLAGWSITSSTGSPTISLSGSIAPLGYYLLTRTSLTSIPGITADKSYTGALSNEGATLTLSDGASSIDVVAGGSAWKDIGGSNETKETAQRTGSNTWVTAVGTPRAANSSASSDDEVPEETEETATTTPVITVGGTSVSSALPSSVPKLYLSIGPNRIVATKAETDFMAYVYDEEGKSKRHVDVAWSFGDGGHEEGQQVRHAYRVDGTYAVTARAQTEQASVVRMITVEAERVDVALERAPGEGIYVENNTNRLVDLSSWILRAGSRRFIIPQDTVLLSGSRVLFPESVTRLDSFSEKLSLTYPGGEEAAVRAGATVEVLSEKVLVP